jgi:hypothetical protein
MKRFMFKVEVRGQRETYLFDTKAEAEAYAITATAWVRGQYRITRVLAEVNA